MILMELIKKYKSTIALSKTKLGRTGISPVQFQSVAFFGQFEG